MVKVIEAIFSHGVLEPLEALDLKENQRVRLSVQTLDGEPAADRSEAMKRLVERLERSSFSHGGPYPSRDELHERNDRV